MDVSVPLKDSSDAELLAELEHRHLGISEALGNHERVARYWISSWRVEAKLSAALIDRFDPNQEGFITINAQQGSNRYFARH